MYKLKSFLFIMFTLLICSCSLSIDNPNGSEGSGNDGDDSSAALIHLVLRSVKDGENALRYTFFTPVVSAKNENIIYKWDFDDNSAIVTNHRNLMDHTFAKYGGTHNVQVTINNGSSEKSVILPITLDKPTIWFECRQTALTAYCTPYISEKTIKNTDYVWKITDTLNQGNIIEDIKSKGSNEVQIHTTKPSTFRIELIGTHDTVEGEMNYVGEISFLSDTEKRINLSDIFVDASADQLNYELSVQATTENISDIEFCWEFDSKSKECDNSGNWHPGVTNNFNNTYTDIKHKTYNSYNKDGYIVTVYARDALTKQEKVSKTRKLLIHLPDTIDIIAQGEGFDWTFQPNDSVLNNIAGDLSYIWTIEGKEQVPTKNKIFPYTFDSEGVKQVELKVVNDKLPKPIKGSTTINVSSEIANLTIETELENSKGDFKTYNISTPAYSIKGKEIEYIWSIDGQEIPNSNKQKIIYTFDKYNNSYSIELKVKIKETGKIYTANKMEKTFVPDLNIEANSYGILNSAVNFKNTIKISDTDILKHIKAPKYQWDFDDSLKGTKAEENITYTKGGNKFIQLVVKAENIAGEIKATKNIYIGNIGLSCSFKSGDKTHAVYTCQAVNLDEDQKKWKMTLTYEEYINGILIDKPIDITQPVDLTFYMKENEKATVLAKEREIKVYWKAGPDESNFLANGMFGPEIYRITEDKIGAVKDVSKLTGMLSFIVTKDGKLFSAYNGSNEGYNGQAGRNTTSNANPTAPYRTYGEVTGFEGTPKKVFNFDTFAFLITEEGELYAWGNNKNYQLGIDSNINKNYPTKVTLPADAVITDIKASKSENMVIAIDNNGKSYGWGSALNKYKPEALSLTSSVNEITSYEDLVYFTTQDNKLYVIGEDKLYNGKGAGFSGITQLYSNFTAPQEVTYFSTNNIKVDKIINVSNYGVWINATDSKAYRWGGLGKHYGLDLLGLGLTGDTCMVTPREYYNGKDGKIKKAITQYTFQESLSVGKSLVGIDSKLYSNIFITENGNIYGSGWHKTTELLGLDLSALKNGLTNFEGWLAKRKDLKNVTDIFDCSVTGTSACIIAMENNGTLHSWAKQSDDESNPNRLGRKVEKGILSGLVGAILKLLGLDVLNDVLFASDENEYKSLKNVNNVATLHETTSLLARTNANQFYHVKEKNTDSVTLPVPIVGEIIQLDGDIEENKSFAIFTGDGNIYLKGSDINGFEVGKGSSTLIFFNEQR